MEIDAIVIERIRSLLPELEEAQFEKVCELETRFTYSSSEPIPKEELEQREWKKIEKGERWGQRWGRAWFTFSAAVSQELVRNFGNYEAHIDIEAEGCVYLNDKPYIGITSHPEGLHRKKRVPLQAEMFSERKIEVLVDASANRLFGAHDVDGFHLGEAWLVRPDRAAEKLFLDMSFLLELALVLPEDSGRRRTILRSLNDCANIIHELDGPKRVAAILPPLLRGQGSELATEAVSLGHSHLDLAWLWPMQETRRKALRTSATMLRMLERYPGYFFGFSQPQMYEWIEEDEPALFQEITERIAEGRWECFGALWVEPDTNLPSHESLIRQCLYGKKYWKSKFGMSPNSAWLPDTFGFSAALPQVLKGCGIDNFITIKLSRMP